MSIGDLSKMTRKFSHNLVINTKATSKLSESASKRNYHRYRYYNVYKNLLRDLKIHYKSRYNVLVGDIR